MTKHEFETKYRDALKGSNKFFQGKIGKLSKSILKEIDPKAVNLQTLQLSIDIALKINAISEQRTLFILEYLLINDKDHS